MSGLDASSPRPPTCPSFSDLPHLLVKEPEPTSNRSNRQTKPHFHELCAARSRRRNAPRTPHADRIGVVQLRHFRPVFGDPRRGYLRARPRCLEPAGLHTLARLPGQPPERNCSGHPAAASKPWPSSPWLERFPTHLRRSTSFGTRSPVHPAVVCSKKSRPMVPLIRLSRPPASDSRRSLEHSGSSAAPSGPGCVDATSRTRAPKSSRPKRPPLPNLARRTSPACAE
jgi:hypothetical protein